ncbi:MAG: Rrf2 family transcriptional regulator [Bdellovibrionales bacterium]|nr:Rrf2 family transcriptional regulator [Bdellovibrionales bacterium]
MNVSALEEYGLRCAVRLAQARQNPDKNSLSAPEIAELEGLSVEYVSKFMLHLKRAGLVNASRGVNGGFSLAREPSEVSLASVFEALGGKRKSSEEFCSSYAGRSESCVRLDGCSIRPFWKILSGYIDEFTREMTLQDLLKGEQETLLKTEEIARRNVDQIREQIRAERLGKQVT